MRKILLFALFFICFSATAQQLIPLTNYYQRNWQVINPAAMNRILYEKRESPNLLLSFNGQLQHLGTPNAPRNGIVAIEKQLTNSLSTFGGVASFDKFGAFGIYSAKINYRYGIKVNDDRILYTGLGINVNWQTINTSELSANSNNDPMDPILSNPLINRTNRSLDASFGAFYKVNLENSSSFLDEFYAGLSATNLVTLFFKTNHQSILEYRNKSVLTNPNVVLIVGGITMDNGYFQNSGVFEPSLIMRWQPSQFYQTFGTQKQFPLSIDLGCRYIPKDMPIWFGGSYGTNQIANFSMGYKTKLNDNVDPLQISLNYGFPLFNRYARLGSILEFNLAYAWTY